MPHADLKYSPDLSFDPQAMFTAIEQTILPMIPVPAIANAAAIRPRPAITPIC